MGADFLNEGSAHWGVGRLGNIKSRGTSLSSGSPEVSLRVIVT